MNDEEELPLPRTGALFTWRRQVIFVVIAAALLGIGHGLERTVHRMVSHDMWHLTATGWAPLAWFAWLMAAPAILALVGRFRRGRDEFPRRFARLVIGCLLIYGVVVNARFVLGAVPRLWDASPDGFGLDWHTFTVLNLASLPMDFLTFGGFFAAALAIDYYNQHRQRVEEMLSLRLRTAQLESELANAEIRALRGQLHPHFLFNSFNAVATLVRQNRNDAAVEVIAELSMLLRLAMQRTGLHELPLEDELDFVRRYLVIEQIRFGEKLQTQFTIEPDTLNARVPNLLLQPLVENAIKHGISRRTATGVLQIGARFVGERLELTVENDGPDEASLPAAASSCSGVGLSNTRARLDKIYGMNYALELARRGDGGMRVCLSLPRSQCITTAPKDENDSDPSGG